VRVEAEEAMRKLLLPLNGLAALALLEGEPALAVSNYIKVPPPPPKNP